MKYAQNILRSENNRQKAENSLQFALSLIKKAANILRNAQVHFC